jgi:hypothetical protein
MAVNKKIILVFLLSLAVRFSFLLAAPERPAALDDTISWDSVAWNVINGKGFTESDGTTPTFFRPPVYPLFLGGVYKIFGHGYFTAKAANAVVDSVTVVLMMAITLKAFNNPFVSLITGLVLAFYPPLLVYNGIIGSEILYTFLLAASIYLLMKDKYVLSGLVMGAATQCRTTTILYPAFLLLILLLIKKKDAAKLNPKKAAALIIPFALLLIPWSIRNYEVFGVFSPVNVGAGHLFWSGTSVELGGKHAVAGKNDLSDVYPDLSKYSMMKQDQIAFGKGFENIYKHPFGFVKLTAKKFIWFLFQPVGQVLAERFNPILGKLLYIPHAVLILLAGWGIYLSRKRFWELLPVTSVLAYFVIMHSIISTIPRYRLPVEPYLVSFAVYAVYAALKTKAGKFSGEAAGA